jgi:hypothetical protein
MSVGKYLSRGWKATKNHYSGGSSDSSAALALTGNKAGYMYQSELSGTQDKLLRKALSQMGLTSAQTLNVTSDLTGSPRKVIETALGRAAALQDGGGGNGSAFDTR